MNSSRIELFQRMPIFGAIHDDALVFLIERSQSVSAKEGEFFFREGDIAGGMFVLEKGSVAISKAWDGREFTLRQLGAGDCFGEMALMDLQPRSASVRAIEDCVALELRPEELHQLFERDREQFALIQMNMGREVCRRLRAMDDMLFHAEMGANQVPTARFRST